MVSVIILTYNSQKHLPALFASLASQTYSAIEYIVVDNASADTTVQWVTDQQILPVDHFIKNTTNDWYAKGNNKGIDVAQGEYILLCNDDVALEPDCIEILVKECEANPAIGIIGGKLLKNDKGTIDSTGLGIKHNRQFFNRGENTKDHGQYDKAEYVFGITGALMLIKREALEKIRYEREYIDEDFIAYKDDIDISWRMWRAGYKVYYQPKAVAYHARTIQQATLQERNKKSAIIRAYSYRNHIWTLIKNEQYSSFIKDSWRIFPYEFIKLIYILIFEWKTVAIIPQLLGGISKMKKKRIKLNAEMDPIKMFLQ